MREDSVKSHILKLLEGKGKGWIYGGQIEDYIRQVLGAKSSNASRRCRELWQAGLVERQLVKVPGCPAKIVQYRERQPVRWEVITERESGKEVARVPIYSQHGEDTV